MINISEKTLSDLQFPEIRERLSAFCITTPGRDKALKIKPFKTGDATFFALQQTREYQQSFYEDERIPGHGFEGVDQEIHLLKIENSILELRGFQKITSLSETANAQLRFFKKHQTIYPHLYQTTAQVDYTEVLIQHIKAVIDRFGQVKNEASPLLHKIRQSIHSVRQQINSSFSADMSRYQGLGYLDDIRESVIDNKRVLAVSASYRKKVNGAVLGRSKTGSIVFIQPENTLKYARELNNLEYDEKEEVKRILSELTESIRPFRELLIDYQDLLSQLDLISAKVKFGKTMQGVLPKITKKRELHLKEAYHPLLYLTNQQAGKPTYPQDLQLQPDNRIIVISGPNAGGKSITLKTVGLLQIMLQSGMPVPVHPYSRMCFFKTVLSDIGDHQSIENHLSTYSYRLKNMRYFLKKCDRNTLFLIDEFGTGSDPELGGALAETFLEVFHEKKAYGIITTHYANLKKMANETAGISNANMRFDSKSLRPEFKLQLGEAGSSFTFEVAQKNGIRYHLINRAKKKVARGKIRFDRSIAKLQQERSKLNKTRQQLEDTQLETAKNKTQLDKKNKRIQEKLESFQALFDHNQRLIHLGQKLDQLNQRYFHNANKKQLIADFLKIVAVENSKREGENKKKIKQEQQRLKKAKQEALQKIKPIRKKRKAEKKQAHKKAKKAEEKRIAALALHDEVRIEGSRAIGTINRIEKGKAVVNYGMFTTETALEKLELVNKKK